MSRKNQGPADKNQGLRAQDSAMFQDCCILSSTNVSNGGRWSLTAQGWIGD